MRLLVAYHGIRTGLTNPNWTYRLQDWLIRNAVRAPVMITDHYKARPLPWVNWFKNRAHGKALANRVEMLAKRQDKWLPIDMVAHSNGCNIVLNALERLADRGVIVNRVIFIAGAIDNNPLQNGLMDLAIGGYLSRAEAWWSRSDKIIGMPSVVKWPYGDLGHTGWVNDAGNPLPAAHPVFPGVERPGYGHCGWFAPEHIESTFEEIATALSIPLHPEPNAVVHGFQSERN